MVAESRLMPTGTVTFLLTDVEGSTRAWEAEPERMRDAMRRHDEVLASVVEVSGGFRPVEQGEGDSMVASFSRASDAITAAVTGQQALMDELDGFLRVRMALHTGEALVSDEGRYDGPTIIRCARLRSCGHGGQILVSRTTADLVVDQLPDGVALVCLGRHRLRDLHRPEEVWQIEAPGLPSRFAPLQSLDAFPTNLPVALNPLIGRQAELADLTRLLGDGGARLATLTGSGGVGKTHLALQVATDCVELFPDGVWWVDLAAVENADRVGDAIADAIGLPEMPAVPALDQVIRAVADSRVLLVLDNCEHLIDSCAHTSDQLLRSCSAVTVLATSREPLGTGSEFVWRVPSLALPTGSSRSVDELRASDAVRLFVDRARRARPRFELLPDNASVVREICMRLDGIPLAIELAAARIRVAPVERVAHELDERFRILTGGSRTVLPRLQTLLASVEWSHDLLTDDERLLFRRLSVFVSSCSLEAAEQVVAGADLDVYQVPDVLARLVDKSLVLLDDATGRYQMLETIRQYALDRCRAAGELGPLRDRHLQWAIKFLEQLDPSPDHDTCESPVMVAIDTDYPNLRAALEWSMPGRTDDAFRLVCSLATYWGLAGRHRDAVALADPVLAVAKEVDHESWSRLVSLLAWVRVVGGDLEFITQDTVEALTIAQTTGDQASEARCLYGMAAVMGGESERLERVFELSSAAGNVRFKNYGALIAAGSVLGTERAEWLLERASALGVGFDDETFHFFLPGWLALHCALRGDQARAASLARQALAHQSDAIGAVFNVVAGAVYVALQGEDAELLQLAADYARPELRDLPASAWWVQLLDEAVGLVSPEPLLSSVEVPLPLTLVLFQSELIRQVLLSGGRFDDAERWAAQVPLTFPAAHAGAALACAWAAVSRGGSQEGTARTHEALSEAVGLGLRPLMTEGIELLASQWVDDGHAVDAARLLGAAAAAREEMGLRWRFPYHHAAAEGAAERARAAVGDHAFQEAYGEGTASSLADSVGYAQRTRGERRRPRRGWDALTPTEVAVAREIAAGRTNAEAAQRLFVATSTVKTHLENIYAKLGIRGRAALAAEATRHPAD